LVTHIANVGLAVGPMPIRICGVVYHVPTLLCKDSQGGGRLIPARAISGGAPVNVETPEIVSVPVNIWAIRVPGPLITTLGARVGAVCESADQIAGQMPLPATLCASATGAIHERE